VVRYTIKPCACVSNMLLHGIATLRIARGLQDESFCLKPSVACVFQGRVWETLCESEKL
jgi:hypothetical protein